jgi:acetyl-CoA C-acetyltransferase
VSACRTPIGSYRGALSSLSVTQLAAHAITHALQRSGVSGDNVDMLCMGCVMTAGVGQNPARIAALEAGTHLYSVHILNINRRLTNIS